MDLDRPRPLQVMHADTDAILSRERFLGYQHASRLRSVHPPAPRQISSTFWTAPVDDLDIENLEYFRHCAEHDFHLQACAQCGRLRYPPTTACPWCATLESTWKKVEGKGTVHSYSEVHHAIQPAFRGHTPYLILVVDLDTQKGEPTPDEALRVVGNLCTPDGQLAPADQVRQVGIGTRVRMVFSDVAPGLALPQWTIDATAPQPANVWRYPQE